MVRTAVYERRLKESCLSEPEFVAAKLLWGLASVISSGSQYSRLRHSSAPRFKGGRHPWEYRPLDC